jgi:hypothetical protein
MNIYCWCIFSSEIDCNLFREDDCYSRAELGSVREYMVKNTVVKNTVVKNTVVKNTVVKIIGCG